MPTAKRYECPACGFPTYNRRVAKCESCKQELPAELLFTAAEIAVLDAEHLKSQKEREARIAREREDEWRRSGLDKDGFKTWG